MAAVGSVYLTEILPASDSELRSHVFLGEGSFLFKNKKKQAGGIELSLDDYKNSHWANVLWCQSYKMCRTFDFIYLTEGKQEKWGTFILQNKKKQKTQSKPRRGLRRLHCARFLLFKPRVIRQPYTERRRLAPEYMGSNTHTHQRTQLTIVTNIIEREFVATAILYFILNRHAPSGQSRVYRIAQLRTDGVHCRTINS